MNCSKYRILSFRSLRCERVCGAGSTGVESVRGYSPRERPGCIAGSGPGVFERGLGWDGAKRLEGQYRLHILQVAGFGGLMKRGRMQTAPFYNRPWMPSILYETGRTI